MARCSFETGLLLIHHFRKSMAIRGRNADFTMDEVRGSGHIIAAARSLIGLRVVQAGEKYDPNGPRRMEVLKTNLCEYPPALGLELVRQGKDVHLQWGPALSETTEVTRLLQCQIWLEVTLKKKGAMKPGVLLKLCMEEGFTRSTFYRAREALGKKIRISGVKHDSQTIWIWDDQLPLPGSEELDEP